MAITETATRHDSVFTDSSVNGHARHQSPIDQDEYEQESQYNVHGELDGPGPFQMNTASPKVNPFHFLSHPHSPSAEEPLPNNLEDLTMITSQGPRIVSEFHSSPDQISHGDPPIHITKVSRKGVQVTSGPTPADGNRRKLVQKVNKVLRKDSTGQHALVEEHRMADTSSQRQPGESDFANSRRPALQQAPPSPPISDVDVNEEGAETVTTETAEDTDVVGSVEDGAREVSILSHTTETNEAHHLPSFTPMLTAEPSDLGASFPSQRTPSPNNRTDYFSMLELSPTSRPGSSDFGGQHLPVPFSSHRRVSNASSTTSSRPGSLAVVRASRLAQQRADGQLAPEVPADDDDPTDSLGGRTTPSSSRAPVPRINRRMTNPSPVIQTQFPNRSPLVHSHSTFSDSSNPNVPVFDNTALDPDILAQTEVIRRERLERRRRKAEAEAAAAAAATATAAGAASTPALPEPVFEPVRDRSEVRKEKEREEANKEAAKVLVGNLIGEDHVNYVLMYNMLTGIRIGVSRCQAKPARPLTDDDYTARHKFSFDIVGNELTPSAKYDFKFKDYAPWVFRDLRDEHFHLDPADYLLSLTAKYILSELGSPGKSGSFFYFSRDYRFIIKTISHSEHKFLRSILKDYHEHVKNNPHTLLSRFYGLHRVKLPRGRKIHFVIMNNLFPPHRDIHETYDLKGSAYGREYPEEKAKINPRAVLKDKNWVNRGRTLELGPEKRALFSEQLRRDMEFLKHVHVMDYSLLVGIHNMERGNRDNLRENSLHVFHPEVRPVRRKPSVKPPSEASNMRKAVRRSDPKMLDVSSQLPADGSADRRHFLFYQDEGGLRATDEANQDMDVIYYLGIIDICTPYNSVKKLEHFWKAMTEDRNTISCIDPSAYGRRFLNFLLSVMRNGDINLRPSGLLPSDPIIPEPAVGTEQRTPQTVAASGHGTMLGAQSPTSPSSNGMDSGVPRLQHEGVIRESDRQADNFYSTGFSHDNPSINGVNGTNGANGVDRDASTKQPDGFKDAWSHSTQHPQNSIVGHLKAE